MRSTSHGCPIVHDGKIFFFFFFYYQEMVVKVVTRKTVKASVCTPYKGGKFGVCYKFLYYYFLYKFWNLFPTNDSWNSLTKQKKTTTCIPLILGWLIIDPIRKPDPDPILKYQIWVGLDPKILGSGQIRPGNIRFGLSFGWYLQNIWVIGSDPDPTRFGGSRVYPV